MKEDERKRLIELQDLLRGSTRPPSALIVDDNPNDTQITEFHLRSKGVATMSVMDGMDAVKLVARHDFWVIFLDWKLAGASGEQTLKAIRQINRFARVIILTGVFDTHSSEAIKAMSLGAIAVMPKPLTSEQVELIFGSP